MFRLEHSEQPPLEIALMFRSEGSPNTFTSSYSEGIRRACPILRKKLRRLTPFRTRIAKRHTPDPASIAVSR